MTQIYCSMAQINTFNGRNLLSHITSLLSHGRNLLSHSPILHLFTAQTYFSTPKVYFSTVDVKISKFQWLKKHNIQFLLQVSVVRVDSIHGSARKCWEFDTPQIFVPQDNLSNALFFLNLKFIRLLRLWITSFSNKLRIHSSSYECLIFHWESIFLNPLDFKHKMFLNYIQALRVQLCLTIKRIGTQSQNNAWEDRGINIISNCKKFVWMLYHDLNAHKSNA